MRTRWLLAAFLAAGVLALPAAAVAQDPPDSDVPAQVVPEDPAADDPVAPDPSLEPPQVLEDPAPALAPTDVPSVGAPEDAPAFAPPVTDLSRFSDDQRAPRWQQRDDWRARGLFYRWRAGWFVHRDSRWWQWQNRRWTPCPQPGDWSPPVVRPVPVSDPSPHGPVFDPVRDAVAPVVAPTTVPRPSSGQDRQLVIRRALRVCQARYVRAVIVLRVLRSHGRITFVQYQRGVRLALVRRAVCRRVVLRLLVARR